MSTASNLLIIYGAIFSVATPTGIGLNYWAQHEFITVASQIDRDIRQLKKDIRNLEYDKKKGLATDKELWTLDRYYEDLEELESKK